MQIGMIGLGRMGGNMVRRLLRGGHECVVYDLNPNAIAELVAEGASGAGTLDEFVAKLQKPRTAWIMVPAGDPTEGMVKELGQRLEKGDAIVDGGNSYFKDDVRRAQGLAEKGIYYVDAGTSGGVWGLDRGYCLMIGGDREGKQSTAEEGYLHCGPVGSGHFVKMVHNGIEYGLMQAYAEGFDIFRNATSQSLPEAHRYDLDLADIAEVWRRGSVVSSWLLDLTASALAENPDLSEYTGFVQDSGEGRWTVQAAIEEAVPVHVLASSLFDRFRSRQEHTFGDKMLSAMRNKFGGHVEQHPADPAAAKKESKS
jgi:6-phosphogluconate dehydrogenase